MAIYNANFKQPVVPYGNLIPQNSHSDSQSPHTDFAPAEWLPLAETATNTLMGYFVYLDVRRNNYMCLMPGKIVAATREPLSYQDLVSKGPVGRMVPAGIRIAWRSAAGADAVIEYGATDVTYRTTDVVTGAYVAAAVSYTKDEVTAGLQARGLLKGTETCEDFISRPVGHMDKAAYSWSGGDGLNPATYNFHNHKTEHKSQIQCDWVLRLPYVPAYQADVAVGAFAATGLGTDAATTLVGLQGGAAGWLSGANFTSFFGSRYSSAPTNADYVVWSPGIRPLSQINIVTPVTADDGSGTDLTSAVFGRRRTSIDSLTQEGDYFVDMSLGVIGFYVALGASLPVPMTGGAATTISLYAHPSDADRLQVDADGVGGADVAPRSVFASVAGNIEPGDFLVCDRWSNLRKYVAREEVATVLDTTADGPLAGSVLENFVFEGLTPGAAAYDKPEDIVAQALTFSRYPRAAMAKRRTFHDNMPTGILDKMPGSATEGYSDLLTYSGGGQFEVIVNMINR